MRCQDFKNKFELYIDNELSDLENAELENHLAQCPNCSKELATLKSIDSLGKMETFAEPEPEYWNQLNQNIIQRIKVPKQKTSWLADRLEQLKEIVLPKRISYRLVGLAATAVIIFFIVRISFIHHGKFEMPAQIGSEDAIEISEQQNYPAAAKDNLALEKKLPERKRLSKINESTQEKVAGLPKGSETAPMPQIPEAAIRDEDNIISIENEFRQKTTAEELAAQKPTVLVSESVVQPEQKAKVDEVRLKAAAMKSQKFEDAQFSVMAVTKSAGKAEYDSSLVRYYKTIQQVRLTPALNEKIDTWQQFLQSNPGEDAVRKATGELAMLYYQLAKENPDQGNIDRAIRFYSENARLLFSMPDSTKFKQQLEMLRVLFKKNE